MTNCNIIKDLLPFYEDKAVSEESRKIISEHLKSCPACRKYHASIKRIPHSLQSTDSRGSYRYSEIAKSLRRSALLSYALGTGLVTISAVCVIKAMLSCREKD